MEPSGHKAYKLVYGFHGRSRWYTIGAADRLGLKEARQIAREKMAAINTAYARIEKERGLR